MFTSLHLCPLLPFLPSDWGSCKLPTVVLTYTIIKSKLISQGENGPSVCVWINSSESYSKDALFLHELSCAEGPEVDVGFTTGDDVGAVAGVELHSKHSLISTLQIQQHTREHLPRTILMSILHWPTVWNKQTSEWRCLEKWLILNI